MSASVTKTVLTTKKLKQLHSHLWINQCLWFLCLLHGRSHGRYWTNTWFHCEHFQVTFFKFSLPSSLNTDPTNFFACRRRYSVWWIPLQIKTFIQACEINPLTVVTNCHKCLWPDQWFECNKFSAALAKEAGIRRRCRNWNVARFPFLC